MSSQNRERNQAGDFLILFSSLLLIFAGWIFVRILSDYQAEVAFPDKALRRADIITRMDEHMICSG